jgi:hypothetical protein
MKLKKSPSLQFVITFQISLLSPLNSNDRSIPLNVISVDQLEKRVMVMGGEVTSSLNEISMDQLIKRVMVRGGRRFSTRPHTHNPTGPCRLCVIKLVTVGLSTGTYDESVLKVSKVSFRRKCAHTGHPLKLLSPTKLAWLGHFPPASQAGRLAGPVFYIISFLCPHLSTVAWIYKDDVNGFPSDICFMRRLMSEKVPKKLSCFEE